MRTCEAIQTSTASKHSEAASASEASKCVVAVHRNEKLKRKTMEKVNVKTKNKKHEGTRFFQET